MVISSRFQSTTDRPDPDAKAAADRETGSCRAVAASAGEVIPAATAATAACGTDAPGPDGPVVGAQLGQVMPCPDEGFLYDVIRARPVRAELIDVAVQGLGVVRVQLADRGIRVVAERVWASICDSSHVY